VGRWKGTAHTARMETHCGWFAEVLQVVQGKALAALTDSAVMDSAVPDSAVTKQLDEQVQAIQNTLVQSNLS